MRIGACSWSWVSLTGMVEPGGVTLVSGSELMEVVEDVSSRTACEEGVSGERVGGSSVMTSLVDWMSEVSEDANVVSASEVAVREDVGVGSIWRRLSVSGTTLSMPAI